MSIPSAVAAKMAVNISLMWFDPSDDLCAHARATALHAFHLNYVTHSSWHQTCVFVCVWLLLGTNRSVSGGYQKTDEAANLFAPWCRPGSKSTALYLSTGSFVCELWLHTDGMHDVSGQHLSRWHSLSESAHSLIAWMSECDSQQQQQRQHWWQQVP